MNNRFDEIYYLYSKDVYKLIYSYLFNIQDTEDILQKTFMKLYNNKKILLLENEEIKKWLFIVCANESKDLLKSFWRSKKSNYELEEIPYNTNTDSFIILDILKDFDSKYRIPFYLHYYEGYTSKEIAEILKISKSVVEVRLFRIKKMIKDKLGDDFL